jgi:hypothetical protein
VKRVIVLSIALTGFCERPTPVATSDHNSYDLARIKTARNRPAGACQARCPLWVKSRHVQRTRACLLSAKSDIVSNNLHKQKDRLAAVLS